MGNLVERAHLDLWRETIVMAAGHANLRQRRELVGGVLDRARDEPRHARRLRLLAASCLETMTSVPEDLTRRLDEALGVLVPPKRVSEAGSLAAVGPSLVRRLPESLEGMSVSAARTTVRTAALIGGEEALERLAGYAARAGKEVRQELVDVWEYFDPDEYARRVLLPLPLEGVRLHLSHSAQWPAALRLRQARHVSIGYAFTDGLAATAALGELDLLWMPWLLGDNDLSPLRHRTGLSNLVLCGMGDLPLLDVEPLRDLTALTNLQLQGWHSIPPLDTIPIPEGLTGLGLGKLAEDVDLGPLFERADWYALVLEGAGAPRGIGDLARLTALERLDFGGFDLSKWLPAQGTWPPALTAMELYRCQLPQDLGPIGTPNTLRNLNLSNCLTTDGQPLALHTLARTPDQPRLTVQVDRTVPLPTTPIPGVRVKHR
jgi:hypothetical protein